MQELDNVHKKIRNALFTMEALPDQIKSGDVWKYWYQRLHAALSYLDMGVFSIRADTALHADLMGAANDLSIPFDVSGMSFINTYTYSDGKMIGVNAFMVRDEIANECLKTVRENLIASGHIQKGGENLTGGIEFETKIEKVSGPAIAANALN